MAVLVETATLVQLVVPVQLVVLQELAARLSAVDWLGLFLVETLQQPLIQQEQFKQPLATVDVLETVASVASVALRLLVVLVVLVRQVQLVVQCFQVD
jgi:hypothetical protein